MIANLLPNIISIDFNGVCLISFLVIWLMNPLLISLGLVDIRQDGPTNISTCLKI